MDQKSNYLKSEELQMTRNYLDRLGTDGIPVMAAYIFGSRLSGQNHPWSDLDLCVVSNAFGRDRQAERVRLLNLRRGPSLLIEPHPYSPNDLENKFDPLARQIKSTGLKVA